MGLTGIRLGARVAAFRRNCNCNVCRIAGAGEKCVRTRTLASLAISGDGERWTTHQRLARSTRADPE